jgi:uncharacterized protein with PQ loop repeat
MDRKLIGQVLLVVGVFCGLFYTLASLYQGHNIFHTLSTALLYLGIVSLISGFVFYGLAGVKRLPSGRKY